MQMRMRMRIRFDSIRSIDRATIDDGWMRLDRSIDRSSGTDRPVSVCVCFVCFVCVTHRSKTKKKNPSDHSYRIDRSTVSIDQSYRSINRSMTDRQTDRRTDERTQSIDRLDSTRPHPSIDSTRPDASIETTDDDRRRPTDRVERHATDARRRRRRRRVTSSRAEEGRRRDDGGETDQQMRDGGVRVRCDRRARRRRTTDANANASGLGQIVDARAK